MPADDPPDAVDVFEVLPQQPRLAHAGLAGDRDKTCAPLLGALFEGVDDARQLALAADERRLEAGTAPGAARTGDDLQRGPGPDRLLAAFDEVLARVLVGDRGLRGSPRDVIDEHRAGRRDRLQSRRRVDGVAQHHPLALGADLDRGVPVSTPARTRRSGIPTSSPSSVTARVSDRAARTARSASSSRAIGVPQTAITASPMNFSTVPP